MFKRSTQLALGILVVFVTSAVSKAPAEDTVHLALSGLHLAADPVRGGGDWWGIFPEDEGYTLQPVRARVEAVVNPLADGDTRKTATQITVPGDLQDIPLLRGLKSAAAGPLVSLKPSKSWGFLPPGETIELTMQRDVLESEMKIVASGRAVAKEPGPSDSTIVSAYELRLIQDAANEKRTQLLVALPEFWRFSYDTGPELMWAGDIDRDGKLDLLYNLRTFYMYTDLALFLSSAAKEGELVGLVARWNAVGGC
jgi:hypothetical protein